MQPWGELMSARGDDLWDIGEGRTGGKDGKEFAVTYTSRGVWTMQGPLGTHGALGSTLGPRYLVPAFLSIVASVPTTQYWSVVRVWARQSAQWGDVPVCHGAMDSKQNVNVSGRKKKWGAPPSLRGGTFTRCYMRWALHLWVKMQSCLWAMNT